MNRAAFVVAVTCSLSVVSPRLDAQTLTLSPSVVQLRGTFGQSTTQTLTIRNASALALAFDLVAKDVLVRDGERVFVEAGELPGSIAATAVFSQRHLVVPPGTAKAVTATVTLQAGAEHRAAVLLFQGTTRIATARGPATASLGTLLTFSLGGRQSLASSPLAVTAQTGSANAAFVQALTNDGAEPVVPKGIVVILDGRGTSLGKAPFEARRLLPGERATFRTEYAGELPAGIYRVLSTFEYEGRAVTRTGALPVR